MLTLTMLLPEPSTPLVFAVTFLSVWFLLWFRKDRPLHPLPPGPQYPLPFLGHVHLISKDPQASLRVLRQRYGDIFSLKLGPHVVVVISSFKLLKDAFLMNGDAFSDRPELFVFNEIIRERRGIILSSGESWKEQRKVALEILREFGLGKNILAEKISEEVVGYLQSLERTSGAVFDPRHRTHLSVCNIICSLVFGRRFEEDDLEMKKCMDSIENNMRAAGRDTLILNFFPFLRFLPGDPFHMERLRRNNKVVDDFIADMYQQHLREYDENCVEDFISGYIREMKRREEEGTPTTLTGNNCFQVIGDLFAAGMETTATTLCWAIIYFQHYPWVQEKCYREIEVHVGSGRLPTLQDKPRLPYVEATAMEIQRKANIAPFGVYHAASQDVIFHGYRIPKNAIILPFMESVLSDPEIWEDPKAFRPERFLDKDGKCLHPEEFIPFSLGRRVCLGESLAKMELFLFLSAMVQRFVFLPPSEGQLPSLQGILGITLCPQPFKVRAVPRK